MKVRVSVKYICVETLMWKVSLKSFLLLQDPGLCSRPLFPSLPGGHQGQFSWVGCDGEKKKRERVLTLWAESACANISARVGQNAKLHLPAQLAASLPNNSVSLQLFVPFHLLILSTAVASSPQKNSAVFGRLAVYNIVKCLPFCRHRFSFSPGCKYAAN